MIVYIHHAAYVADKVHRKQVIDMDNQMQTQQATKIRTEWRDRMVARRAMNPEKGKLDTRFRWPRIPNGRDNFDS